MYVIAFDENLKFLYLVIQNMSGKFRNFIIFFIVLIYCFVVFSHVQFGTQIKSYNNYTNAFLYNLGMMLGSHHELDHMLEYSVVLSSFYIFIFTFILAFIITNMFQIFVKNEYKRLAIEKKKNQKINLEKKDPFKYDLHWYVRISEIFKYTYLRFCLFCCKCCSKENHYQQRIRDRKKLVERYQNEQKKYEHINFDANITDN